MTNNFVLLVIILFVYGLAFFTMGLAIALESRRPSAFPLAHGLKYLAAFGLVHSMVEWIEMLVVIQSQLLIDVDAAPWRVIKVILLAISTVCLLLFSVHVLTETLQKHNWLHWLPAGLFVVWLGSFVIPHLGWIAGEPTAGLSTCLQCHPGQSQTYLTMSGEWLTSAEVWARYLLYLPGSILAALAILTQRSFLKSIHMRKVIIDCQRAAIAFTVNGVAAGLIVPPAPYFPASMLNYATFFTWLHMPPQILRAALAFIIAYFILRILRVFEVEKTRQLEAANRDRFEAQQAALEAQRRAREEIESWSKQLETTVKIRTRELEALYKIGTEISALLDLDRILESVVENARQLLGAEVATLSLLDEDAGELAVRAVAGTRTAAFQQIRMPVGRGIAGRAVALGEVIAVADYRIDPSFTHELDAIIEAEGLTCHIAVPLSVGDRIVGALYVADRSNRTFTDAEARLLARLANQASIAIENARLYVQVQNLAVLEERDRLAREMHDSLAQSLGYLSLKSNVVAGLLSKGEVSKAEAELRQMERAADDAYADVRESILGLRSTVLPGRGLITTLSQYLHKYGLQHHIHVELAVCDNVQIRFSPATEVQVVRIIQEALANVRKHAQASSAWVRFKAEPGWMIVTISDNGRGFDLDEVLARSGDHFGLQTMRERAESVGGQLTVHSTRGLGSEISVRLPESGNGGRL
ncbi:MAG: GAF domain-containing protein [Chloroflexi bacterium]|nr:GAF domain-containing protein [Chloroflexota bacterium]